MTREDMQKVLAVIDNVYVNWHPKDAKLTLEVWLRLLKDYSAADVGEALRRYMVSDTSGFAPIPELLEKGVNVTLGTDGAASNNNLNLFEEMHLAAIVHNGRLKDTTLMDTDTVIDMATVNGAKAQGRTDCGELKAGFKADLIALDLNKPHFWGNAADKSLITYSAQGSDVCMTMVDGKILYENGEYLTLDKGKILYETNELLH